MSMKFQLIMFKDHHHENETWIDPRTYDPSPVFLEYVGWVTHESEEMVVLSQGRTVDENSVDYDSHIHILKNSITKRKTIKIS